MKTIKWGKVALRLIVLPFYMGWVLIHHIKSFVIGCLDFLLYGGEMITYNKVMNQKTIGETYLLIQEKSHEQTK